MTRKHKSGGGSVPIFTVVVVLLICTGLVFTGVGYVWHRNRNEKLAHSIHAVETQILKLRQRGGAMDQRLNTLRSPEQVRERVRRMGLGLTMPAQEQILRLPEPAGESDPVSPNPTVMRMAARPLPR